MFIYKDLIPLNLFQAISYAMSKPQKRTLIYRFIANISKPINLFPCLSWFRSTSHMLTLFVYDYYAEFIGRYAEKCGFCPNLPGI